MPLCADTQRPQLVGLGVLLPLGTAVACLKGQVKTSWDTGNFRGGGAGNPQCSYRGRPGFRGTLWVASRVPSALSTSNS